MRNTPRPPDAPEKPRKSYPGRKELPESGGEIYETRIWLVAALVAAFASGGAIYMATHNSKKKEVPADGITEGQPAPTDNKNHEFIEPIRRLESLERLKQSTVELVLDIDGTEQIVPAVMVRKNIFATATGNFPTNHGTFLKSVQNHDGTLWSMMDDVGKLKNGYGSASNELGGIPAVTFIVVTGDMEKGTNDVKNAISVVLPEIGEEVRLGSFDGNGDRIFRGSFAGETATGLFAVNVPGFHGEKGQGIFNHDDELIGVVTEIGPGQVFFSPLGKKVEDDEVDRPTDLTALNLPPEHGPTFELDPQLFPDARPDTQDKEVKKEGKLKKPENHPKPERKRPTPQQLAENESERQKKKEAAKAESERKAEARKIAREALKEARDRARHDAEIRAHEREMQIADEQQRFENAIRNAKCQSSPECCGGGDGIGRIHTFGLGKIDTGGGIGLIPKSSPSLTDDARNRKEALRQQADSEARKQRCEKLDRNIRSNPGRYGIVNRRK